MVQRYFLSVFTVLNSIKKRSKFNYIIWENFLLVDLLGYNLFFGGLHFWKVFYHLKILGWTPGFHAIDDLSSAHWDETEFRALVFGSQIGEELQITC